MRKVTNTSAQHSHGGGTFLGLGTGFEPCPTGWLPPQPVDTNALAATRARSLPRKYVAKLNETQPYCRILRSCACSRCRASMGYLTIIGGGVHRMADHRHALHASRPVSHRARDRRHQRLLRAHDRIDVPDQTGRRQQGRDLHRRSRLLPRHAGGHQQRAGDHQHGVLHRSQGRGPRSFCKGAGGASTGRRTRHARRRCDWKSRRIPVNGEPAQGSGLPGRSRIKASRGIGLRV